MELFRHQRQQNFTPQQMYVVTCRKPSIMVWLSRQRGSQDFDTLALRGPCGQGPPFEAVRYSF